MKCYMVLSLITILSVVAADTSTDKTQPLTNLIPDIAQEMPMNVQMDSLSASSVNSPAAS